MNSSQIIVLENKRPEIVKKELVCEICNKGFKPMTDKQWANVKYLHNTLSQRHIAYLSLKQKENKVEG